MGAAEFCAWLASLLERHPPPPVTWWSTFSQAGFTHSRYGVILRVPSGGHIVAQVCATGEATGLRGTPPPPQEPPMLNAGSPTLVADIEHWIASQVCLAQDPRILGVRRFSHHEDLGDDHRQPYGVEITCHDRSRVLVLFPYLLSPGIYPGPRHLFRARAGV